MRCPRCLLADIPETTRTCVLCGYSPVAGARAGPAARTPPPAAEVSAEAAPPAAASELEARRELAREFTLEGLLEQRPGQIAYLAHDAEARPVTVHAIPRPQPRDAATEERFFRAADAAAALDHPHIVPLHRRGVTKTFLWYSTKRVEGRSLDEMLSAAGPIDLAACQRILEQVASALDYAHRRGIVHGALEPACVLVDANEWVLVGDFALGGLAARGAPGPDALLAAEPTAAADQGALAALAYACLTGAPPAPGKVAPALAEVRPEIPLHVSEALRRGLSERPGDRFPSVLDLVAAIAGTRATPATPWFTRTPRRGPGSPVVIMDYDDEEPGPRRASRFVAAGVGFVIALGAGGAWLSMSSAPATPATSQTRGYTPPPATPVAPAPQPPPQSAPTARTERMPEPARPQVDPPRVTVTRPAPRAIPPAVPRDRATVAPRVSPLAEPGHLSINAIPWGNVYIDAEPVGNTPQLDLPIAPGTHRLRVEREGFRPYERIIDVAPGQKLRITDIVLRDLVP